MPVEVASSELRVETSGGVCTLTLDRPHRRNALSPTLVNALVVALERAAEAEDVRVVVLQGAGGVFCSGADLVQVAGEPAGPDALPWRGGFVELNLALRRLGLPVIAKVRGYALAGGLGLVAASTFALAEDTATFATPEIDVGLFPMMIMASLARVVPPRRALELVLTGRRIDAREAEAIGLVNRAVPPERLDEEVDALARTLAAKPPTVLRMGLRAWHRQADMRLEDALPYLQDAFLEVLGTDEAREGLAAFLARRGAKGAGRT